MLFPRDPARRLEMLWNNTASRSGTQVIAINGKSAWAAPRGVKLGAQLAAVEKLNGKPFKLTAFGADGSTAADWQEGALLKLQGGCKMGMRFVADPRAPQEARAELAAAQGIAVERRQRSRLAADGGGDSDRLLAEETCTLRARGAQRDDIGGCTCRPVVTDVGKAAVAVLAVLLTAMPAAAQGVKARTSAVPELNPGEPADRR